MDPDAVRLIAFKQPINGMFNALIAGTIPLVLKFSTEWRKKLRLERPRLEGLLFHILLTSILLAGAIPIIHDGYQQRTDQETFLAVRLTEQTRRLAKQVGELDADKLESWTAELAAAIPDPAPHSAWHPPISAANVAWAAMNTPIIPAASIALVTSSSESPIALAAPMQAPGSPPQAPAVGAATITPIELFISIIAVT